MRLFFFDIETTGLPKKRGETPDWDNLKSFPYIVEMAWLVRDSEGVEVNRGRVILRPDGYRIPKNASGIHGITTKIAKAEGVLREDFFPGICRELRSVDAIVAHNLEFDMNTLSAEFLRHRLTFNFQKVKQFCTMKSSTNICALKSKYHSDYKWPTLRELHLELFKKSFDRAHSATADLDACVRCFDELVERGVFSVRPPASPSLPAEYVQARRAEIRLLLFYALVFAFLFVFGLTIKG